VRSSSSPYRAGRRSTGRSRAAASLVALRRRGAPSGASRSLCTDLLELDFRWDEKADPPRSTLCEGLQIYASSIGLNERRIGPWMMVAKELRG
jgi:hypothetical protein